MKEGLRSEIIRAFLLVSFLPTALIFIFLTTSTWLMMRKHAQQDLEEQSKLMALVVMESLKDRTAGYDYGYMKNLTKEIWKRCSKKVTIVDKKDVIIASSNSEQPGRKYPLNIWDKVRAFREHNAGGKNNVPAFVCSAAFGPAKRLLIVPFFDGAGKYAGAIISDYNLAGSGAIYVLKHLFLFWAVMLVCILTMATIYALYFSYKLMEPVDALKKGAEAVGRGDLSFRVEMSCRNEFALLAETFNWMTSRLKKSYDSLSDLSAYLSTVLDTMGSMVFVIDEQGIIEAVNKTVTGLLGYTKDELIGTEICEIASRQFWGNGDSYVEENSMSKCSFLTKDAQLIPCLVARSKAKLEGRVLNVVSAQDLRPVVKLQHRLAEEKERLMVTLKSIGDGVIVTDIGGNVILMNAVAEDLTGWTEKEANGKSLDRVFRIIGANDEEGVASPFDKALRSARVVDLEEDTILVARDGSERMIKASCAPIKDEGQNIIGTVLVFQDITQEKIIREELIKTEKMESIAVLAGGIAHDFNNILSGIMGNIELAQMVTGREHKASRYLFQAAKAVLRAADLTKQLLTFAKGGEPIKEVASLEEVIRDSASFVITGSNVDCIFEFHDDLWPVEIDKGQISQVIQNLVINARHAMASGGTIRIECRNISEKEACSLAIRPVAKYVELKVKDAGGGIPEEYVDKIFEPFFTTKETGSGLGLSICHSIVKRHGGHIRVSSRSGRGTTFFIFLPALGDGPVEAREFDSMVVRPGSGRVLVMDDEEILRHVAKGLLESLGLDVVLARDGKEAIELFKKAQQEGKPFDVVVMDLTVKGAMGGLEATRELLSIDPGAKVIVASGYANDPIMASYREYGFCSYIVKPYTLEDLARVLYEVMGSSN